MNSITNDQVAGNSNVALSTIDKLLELTGSTTNFLQTLWGKKLLVSLELQEETQTAAGIIIRRITMLHNGNVGKAALYCISVLSKDQLTPKEYGLVMDGKSPLGTIFTTINGKEKIQKSGISISVDTDPEICSHMKLRSSMLYKKKYNYCAGSRVLGTITEIFNSESLLRSNED